MISFLRVEKSAVKAQYFNAVAFQRGKSGERQSRVDIGAGRQAGIKHTEVIHAQHVDGFPVIGQIAGAVDLIPAGNKIGDHFRNRQFSGNKLYVVTVCIQSSGYKIIFPRSRTVPRCKVKGQNAVQSRDRTALFHIIYFGRTGQRDICRKRRVGNVLRTRRICRQNDDPIGFRFHADGGKLGDRLIVLVRNGRACPFGFAG